MILGAFLKSDRQRIRTWLSGRWSEKGHEPTSPNARRQPAAAARKTAECNSHVHSLPLPRVLQRPNWRKHRVRASAVLPVSVGRKASAQVARLQEHAIARRQAKPDRRRV